MKSLTFSTYICSIFWFCYFKSSIFRPLWPWSLKHDVKNNRVPLLYHLKLCASFHSHLSYSPEALKSGKNRWLCGSCNNKIWRKTAKTIGQLFSATSGIVHHLVVICEFKLELRLVRKRPNGGKYVLNSVTLTFDLWLFAWTLLLSMIITPENFMMMRWGKKVWQTGKQADRTIELLRRD